MNDLHQILPWFMNGTLDSAERASFESHLAECRACRDEMSVIEAPHPADAGRGVD